MTATALPTAALGRTGFSITRVGFGAWAAGGDWMFGWGHQDDAQSIAAIRRAVDLGINCEAEKYLNALEAEKADILGMSALLTTTMPYMKVVIDEMVAKGMREDYIILVGGAPLNEEFGKAIGADAYCRDAAVAVETAKQMMARKHNRPSAG